MNPLVQGRRHRDRTPVVTTACWWNLVSWQRQCQNGDHPLHAWILAAHTATGRPSRCPEWGMPASVLANLQRSIDSASLSPRSSRASDQIGKFRKKKDQIGKDRRWGRLSGDDNGRRRMARHGGERGGRHRRQVRRWRQGREVGFM
jgi:hypothetical protein